MLFHNILAAISLVASVSAIDLRFFDQNNCRRNYWVACNNANPEFCCFTTDDKYTVSSGLFAIPREWSLVCQWWDQTGCSSGPMIATTLNYGNDYVCWGTAAEGRRFARGISYYFNSRKREVKKRSTEGCQRANVLHLSDGSEYDLADLNNATYSEVASTIDRRDKACRNIKDSRKTSHKVAIKSVTHLHNRYGAALWTFGND